jgi:hypothetical protein
MMFKHHSITTFLMAIVLFTGISSSEEPMTKEDKKVIRQDSVPTDLNALNKEYPELVHNLFERLNMNYPGLEKVKQFVVQNKWVEACSALIDYYKNKNNDHSLWLKNKNSKDFQNEIVIANNVINDIFTFQEVTGHQDTLENGQLNWYYTGPRNDKEWGYFLNRQGYFNDLLDAYKSSGNSVYAKKFDDLICNWVLINPLPTKKVSTVTWRELEVGLRLTGDHWPRAFYGFQPSSAFSDVGRILMLSSVPQQANYLMHYHRMHSNWAAMELNGLASAAFYWPEFNHAPLWLKHATTKMEVELAYEVYPGGVQNELTSHYHEVALRNFEEFSTLCMKNGHKLPEVFRKTIEKMYNYLAYTIRPDGFGLLNNDSNLDYTRDEILKAAKKFDRLDWKFIATNGGEGRKPAREPSVFFPWAGQMIMRNGWGSQDEWAFFDVGPWGNAHQHNDKLHLSVSAFGHDWLVDAGRYYYKRDKWRKYFLSSSSHNVILIDGEGQRPYQKLANSPKSNNFSIQKNINFSMGSYTSGFGSDWWEGDKTAGQVIAAKHTRAVIYLYNKYWVVLDHISTPKGRTIEPLWHFAPECKVKIDGKSVLATDSNNATLQIIPSSPSRWQTNLLEGQEFPIIQGWYSKTYNEKVPNYCVEYQTTSMDTATTFAWVIYPSETGKQNIKIKVLSTPPGTCRMNISIPGRPSVEVVVRFYGDEEVPLSSGLFLDGKCAVLAKNNPPVVACGVIRNENGKAIVTDTSHLALPIK